MNTLSDFYGAERSGDHIDVDRNIIPEYFKCNIFVKLIFFLRYLPIMGEINITFLHIAQYKILIIER